MWTAPKRACEQRFYMLHGHRLLAGAIRTWLKITGLQSTSVLHLFTTRKELWRRPHDHFPFQLRVSAANPGNRRFTMLTLTGNRRILPV